MRLPPPAAAISSAQRSRLRRLSQQRTEAEAARAVATTLAVQRGLLAPAATVDDAVSEAASQTGAAAPRWGMLQKAVAERKFESPARPRRTTIAETARPGVRSAFGSGKFKLDLSRTDAQPGSRENSPGRSPRRSPRAEGSMRERSLSRSGSGIRAAVAAVAAASPRNVSPRGEPQGRAAGGAGRARACSTHRRTTAEAGSINVDLVDLEEMSAKVRI